LIRLSTSTTDFWGSTPSAIKYHLILTSSGVWDIIFHLSIVVIFQFSDKSSKGIALNLLAAVFWGITFALFYMPIQTLGIWAFGFVLEISVLITSLLLVIARKENLNFNEFKSACKWFIALGVLGFGGVLFFNISTQYLPMSLLSLLGISTIFISLLISKFWLKEALTIKEKISVVLFVAAIVILMLFN